ACRWPPAPGAPATGCTTPPPPPAPAANNTSHNRVRPLREVRDGRRSCSREGSLVSMMSCMFALIPLLDNSRSSEFIRHYVARFHHFRSPRPDIRDNSENIRQTSVLLSVVDRLVLSGSDLDTVIGQRRRHGA